MVASFSDLHRTKQTAAAVLKYHNQEHFLENRVREKGAGVFEGAPNSAQAYEARALGSM